MNASGRRGGRSARSGRAGRLLAAAGPPLPPPPSASSGRAAAPSAAQSGVRRQRGVRVPSRTAGLLRKEASKSGDPYHVILGRAYLRCAGRLAAAAAESDPFGVDQHDRGRVGRRAFVMQFSLTDRDWSELETLGRQMDATPASVVRQLLFLYLDEQP